MLGHGGGCILAKARGPKHGECGDLDTVDNIPRRADLGQKQVPHRWVQVRLTSPMCCYAAQKGLPNFRVSALLGTQLGPMTNALSSSP